MPTTIEPLYKSLVRKSKKAGAHDLKGDTTTARLAAVIVASRGFLATLGRAPLLSKIPGKSYFIFSDPVRGKTSRSVNEALYDDALDAAAIEKVLKCDFVGMTSEEITKAVYTCAIAYCCATDILKKSDQKTPGTFFEVLVGHLVARTLGVNPEQQISVPTLDLNITLPTDYVFDLGPGKNRLHLLPSFLPCWPPCRPPHAAVLETGDSGTRPDLLDDRRERLRLSMSGDGRPM